MNIEEENFNAFTKEDLEDEIKNLLESNKLLVGFLKLDDTEFIHQQDVITQFVNNDKIKITDEKYTNTSSLPILRQLAEYINTPEKRQRHLKDEEKDYQRDEFYLVLGLLFSPNPDDNALAKTYIKNVTSIE